MLSTEQVSAASGIYCILHVESGKRYVGQAKRFSERHYEHLKLLKNNKHHCTHLQRAINKYGCAAFSFIILEECDLSIITKREQYWMDHFGFTNLYNLSPTAQSTLGVKYSAESRERMSAQKRGRKHVYSPEGLAKQRESIKRLFTPEIRAKIASKLRGRKQQPELLAKMSAIRKGKKATPETLDRLLKYAKSKKSAAHKAKQAIWVKEGWIKRRQKERSKKTASQIPLFGDDHV